MMRCLNMDQQTLYKQYFRLGEEILWTTKENTNFTDENVWEIISREGIWFLPIAKQYGGQGSGWQDCIVALDGFFASYSDVTFLTTMISQISSLYLISQYGTEKIKKRYLPRLMQGEIANMIIPERITNLLRHHSSYNQTQKYAMNMKNHRIQIYAEKIGNDIAFYICDKENVAYKKINKNIKRIQSEESFFIAKKVGLSVLCDLINFEKLFHEILAASLVKRINSD